MTEIYCVLCERKHSDSTWRYTHGGWICSKWFTPSKKINTMESRSLRPDGSVATGLEGIRLRDRRLKAQQESEKLDKL
jgi:hypothetical protein